MISIDGLAVEFGGTTLFSDVSFVINEKDRIALMGKNGAGKSTLLKILAGVRQPTRGKISAPKDSVIAYLPQQLACPSRIRGRRTDSCLRSRPRLLSRMGQRSHRNEAGRLHQHSTRSKALARRSTGRMVLSSGSGSTGERRLQRMVGSSNR